MGDTKIRRAELEAKALVVETELAQEIIEIKMIAKERGKQILIAGGILAGSYLVYSMLSSKKKAQKSGQIDDASFLGSALKSYAMGIALSFAKDQLLDYLNRIEEKTDQIDSQKDN